MMVEDRNKVITTEAFDTLAAEREPHLQPLVFVEPLRYAAYTGMRSLVIIGDSGSGKTALRMALIRQVASEHAPPTHLVATWQPEPIDDARGSPAVRRFVHHALGACATTLLATLVRHPDLFHSAPPTVQMSLHWFLQAHIVEDR
ncbi:MAG: winged helix-turn-helix domain-containing protein, partial [Roseiflexus sp.]